MLLLNILLVVSSICFGNAPRMRRSENAAVWFKFVPPATCLVRSQPRPSLLHGHVCSFANLIAWRPGLGSHINSGNLLQSSVAYSATWIVVQVGILEAW